ncbi:MAG: hypothetical protein CMJ46_13495 [Planctomyces sp.]|nr:hypothetical protein [Planctomyces sp.]
MSETHKSHHVRVTIVTLVLVTMPVVLYFALFHSQVRTGAANGSAFWEDRDESTPMWTWQLVEQTPEYVRFKAVDIEFIRSDDVLKEARAGRSAELRKEGVEVGDVEVSLAIHSNEDITLDISTEGLETADEVEVHFSYQCLRTGFFGHGSYSGNWMTIFDVEDGKILHGTDHPF